MSTYIYMVAADRSAEYQQAMDAFGRGLSRAAAVELLPLVPSETKTYLTLVSTRTVGRSKLVQANAASPHFGTLAQLVLMSFGPPLVVREEFARLSGAEQVFIFGSWAARYAGEVGPAPNDVDVLLVGTPDRDQAYEAAQRAQDRLGREVNVTLRAPAS
jgi:hypothetical protein